MNRPLFPATPILIVDDDETTLTSLDLALRTGGISNIQTCKDSRNIIPLLKVTEVELILLDLSMPFIAGEKLLPMITEQFPGTLVIIITGKDEVETAVACMKANAFDYMVKPVERSRLISGVRRAIEILDLRRENRNLKERMLNHALKHPEAFSGIVSSDDTMLSVFRYAESVAVSPHPVLITGETGVGKELIARAIHTLSGRKGSFVPVNVAGIDDNVFSDTLFGHIKGAFTGANEPRKGLVETASAGTLLLDEIGDLSPDCQVKLLRLLQEHEFFPVGSDIARRSTARFIFTTNQDLRSLQHAGRFRKDLFFRLSSHRLHLPPLRERPVDVPLLFDHFLAEAFQSLNKKKKGSYPPELIVLLSNYHFPGNVRELRTMVYEAAANHISGKLSMDPFIAYINRERSFPMNESRDNDKPDSSILLDLDRIPTLKQTTALLIAQAMKLCQNNQSNAARLLGISRQRLARYLKSLPQ